MRIVFLGTPEFAVKSLEKLVEHHEVLAVITQPDKPNGRGKKMQPTEVKKWATEHKIPVYEFEKISRDGYDLLKNLKPDIMVTVAYGQIISRQIIELPKYGIINVHASILPKYRGASPIQTAIMKGEKITGVTIMQTDIGLDSGDILNVASLEISESETAGELSNRLANLGADLLIVTLKDIADGSVKRVPQIHSDATFTTKIKKSDVAIHWEKSATQIKNLILSANPDPISNTMLNGEVVKIYNARVAHVENADNEYLTGEILPMSNAKAGVFVKCGTGVIEILTAQMPNGKVLDAKQLFSGRKFKVGDIFESFIQMQEQD